MKVKEQRKQTTYLCAWLGDKDGVPTAYFEHSTAKKYREQGKIKAGIARNGHSVVVFSDYLHGADYLTKDELRLVARSFLDNEYKTIEIDLRY
jgi:hypothetical protein